MSVQLPKLVAFVVVDDEELSPAVREEIWETFHLANDVLSVQKIKNHIKKTEQCRLTMLHLYLVPFIQLYVAHKARTFNLCAQMK